MKKPGDDNDRDRGQRTDPKRDRDRADGTYLAVEKNETDAADDGRKHFWRNIRKDIIHVLLHADETGSNFQWAAQDELPDEKERHQSPPATRAKGFAKVNITAAGAGHGRGEFGPN